MAGGGGAARQVAAVRHGRWRRRGWRRGAVWEALSGWGRGAGRRARESSSIRHARRGRFARAHTVGRRERGREPKGSISNQPWGGPLVVSLCTLRVHRGFLRACVLHESGGAGDREMSCAMCGAVTVGCVCRGAGERGRMRRNDKRVAPREMRGARDGICGLWRREIVGCRGRRSAGQHAVGGSREITWMSGTRVWSGHAVECLEFSHHRGMARTAAPYYRKKTLTAHLILDIFGRAPRLAASLVGPPSDVLTKALITDAETQP
jgi:hypothetical protein